MMKALYSLIPVALGATCGLFYAQSQNFDLVVKKSDPATVVQELIPKVEAEKEVKKTPNNKIEIQPQEPQKEIDKTPKIEPIKAPQKISYSWDEEYIPQQYNNGMPDYTVNAEGRPSGIYRSMCPLVGCPTYWDADGDSVAWVKNPYRGEYRRNTVRRFMAGSAIALDGAVNP